MKQDSQAFISTKAVEFVEYTGKYPQLCRGILVLRINGKEYVFNGKREDGKLVPFYFGWDNTPSDFVNGKLKPGYYKRFWETEGSIEKDENGDLYSVRNGWTVDACKLPQELRSYAQEIEELFNFNVAWGCCGGCIKGDM